MVEQGLAVMGRGCIDALPTSRPDVTAKLTCGEGAPTCPLLPGWALQAGWQPVSCPEMKLGMGTPQKLNNLDSKNELSLPLVTPPKEVQEWDMNPFPYSCCCHLKNFLLKNFI